MSRVAAHDSSPTHEMEPFYLQGVAEEMPAMSKTLEDLLRRVASDVKEPIGDDDYYMAHHAVDVEAPPVAVPFVLSFKNLSYSVKVCRKGRSKGEPAGATRTILSEISGVAREGEILAVMGASGCGKTTLLDALANRIEKRSLKGTVTLNGDVLESKMLKAISAYVMQDDLLYPMLTVEETLMFAAEFRLPRSLTKERKQARVQALIDQLGLRKSVNTIIGDEGHRGVSGGERRRVSIGIDIVHDPIMLFLDEPTSGLDSTCAFMVVKVLQRIARTGSIVIMTVHQPSYRILSLLDTTLFLSGGRAVYSGPPTALPVFFAEFGRPIPEAENRTEYALDLIRELEECPSGINSLVEFNRAWQGLWRAASNKECCKATLAESIKASLSRGKLMTGAPTGDIGESLIPKFANPMWSEIITLAKRTAINSRRQPEIFLMRLISALVTCFLMATLFWQLEDSPRGIQERLGLFAFSMATVYYTCSDGIPVFILERFIYMRETAYNAYRRSSYVICKSLVAIPSLVLLSLAFSVTTFWAAGLSGGFHGFCFYTLLVFASYWAGSSFITFLSAFVPHVILGYIVVVAILAYFLLFSGFFIHRDSIPSYWIWFHYLSLIKYSYEGAMLNEFSDPTKCFIHGVQLFDNTPLGHLPESSKMKLLESLGTTLGMPMTSTTCVTTAADVVAAQGATQLSKWGCLWVIVGAGFFFRIMFYMALMLTTKSKRR